MYFLSHSTFSATAFRTLLTVLCLSVSCGNSTSHLVGSFLPNGNAIAEAESLAEQNTAPEEGPQEAPSPNEPAGEGETDTFAVRRKCPKCIRIRFQLVNLARMSDPRLHSLQLHYAASRLAWARFEHCFRNGCGAHLLC